MANEIMAGTDVFTADGDKIGQAAEVRANAFKVNASMMPDYWLPLDHVLSTDGSSIRLDFTKDALGDHKLDEPAAA